MKESVGERLERATQEAKARYYRLVLLVGEPRSGKTHTLRAAAERTNCIVVNLNLALTERLLELTRKQRALRVKRILLEEFDKLQAETLMLDNIEVLFSKEWQRLWGERVFHMSEFAHSLGVFALPKDERERLIRKSVSIVTRTAAVGVITFCNAREIERAMAAAGEQVVGFRGPYSLCHHVSMLAIGKWSRQNMGGEGVSYVFEDGYKDKYDAYQFMGEIRKMPALKQAYACEAHAFEDKTRFLPIQSADLLAYEFVKFRRELRGDRPVRGSFRALLRDRDLPYKVFEVSPDSMAPWLHFTKELTDTFKSRDVPALPSE